MFSRTTSDMILHELSYYTATALPNKVGLSSKWSKIGKNLYLGKIPLRGDREEIDKVIQETGGAPLGFVLSVNKPPEINQKSFTMDPIRPHEWVADGKVDHYNLQMADFTAIVDINEAANCILAIEEKYRSKDKSVLIHCKAGKSRSAMAACCVLALFDLSADENNKDKSTEELVEMAAKDIKLHRRQVSITAALKHTAVQVVNEAKKIRAKLNPDLAEYNNSEEKLLPNENLTLKQRVDQCFANQEIKEEIRHMEIYQSIAAYKDELMKHTVWKLKQSKPKRVEHVEKLLNSINEAKDSQWYEELVKLDGPATDLINAAPIMNVYDADEDKIKREQLIEKLKNDIESLICLNLGCQKAELREIFPSNDDRLTLRI